MTDMPQGADAQRICELAHENRELKRANGILKRAAGSPGQVGPPAVLAGGPHASSAFSHAT